MPTVPPTFVSLDSDDELFHHPAVITDDADCLSGPTPDPDFDEGILVPVVIGDGVGAVTSHEHFAPKVASKPISMKPRLDLSDLSLHSPSSIVGTPFDVSPRFEYPFPPSGSSAEADSYPPSLNRMMSPFLVPYHSAFLPALPPPLPLSRPEARSHSPTHPKLQHRDPPVPPTLAKKRWSNTISGPIFAQESRPAHSRKRSRSTMSPKTAADSHDESSGSLDASGAEDSDTAFSRRSFLPREMKRRCGKGPEVVHMSPPGLRGRDMLSSGVESSARPQDSPVESIVAGHVPRPYPQNPSSTAHDTIGGMS
ncbi:hypothetical protein PsYK624_124200 [Phanerochaete sordida]|uniref:Uncharacterized protein n=1 Tax=Phanerochaete sordida TaxID=48140 RepID=A0A9P3GK27_9APHY|nr:hypothetical protein PsYK624_124200 [Phanerochaete sordida]